MNLTVLLNMVFQEQISKYEANVFALLSLRETPVTWNKFVRSHSIGYFGELSEDLGGLLGLRL